MAKIAMLVQGKLPLTFAKLGVKINKDYYQNEILVDVVRHEDQKKYKNQQRTFQ